MCGGWGGVCQAALEARLQEAAEDAARSQQALAAAVADSASAEEAAAAAARTEVSHLIPWVKTSLLLYAAALARAAFH